MGGLLVIGGNVLDSWATFYEMSVCSCVGVQTVFPLNERVCFVRYPLVLHWLSIQIR